jgi:DUF3072 family protein
MSEFASNTHQADDTASSLGASSDDVSNPALQKDPDDWVSGDDPMTAASQHIDRLKSQLGIGDSQ